MKTLTVSLTVLAALWIGLEAGYWIGVQSEIQTHRGYIASVNSGVDRG